MLEWNESSQCRQRVIDLYEVLGFRPRRFDDDEESGATFKGLEDDVLGWARTILGGGPCAGLRVGDTDKVSSVCIECDRRHLA